MTTPTLPADWPPGSFSSYLTRASIVSEQTVGDGAMTTSGSPSSVSSHSICRWIRTDWKHLRRTEEEGWGVRAGHHWDQSVVKFITTAGGSTNLKRSSSWMVGRSVGAGSGL